MRWKYTAAIALGMLAVAGNAWAQPSTIDFVVAGPADWNNLNNWNAPGFGPAVPGDGFAQEIVSISNDGIAELTSAAANDVLGVVIGETHDPLRPGGANAVEEAGTLNISGGGQLRLVDPGGTGAAALRVGDAGLGVLNISGGSATADTLSVGGSVDSALNLSGDGTLGISGNANIQRITRIEGAGVTFDVEGDLSVAGTFIPVITGATHSAITASTGNASIDGTLLVQFNGHSPMLGDSWTLIDAAGVSGTFANIDISQAAGLPRGATFAVSYDAGGSGDVKLSLENRLILNVNRQSGAMSMENAVGADIEITGYRVISPSGLLDSSDGNWQSFEDAGMPAWEEANPSSNFLSELNPTGNTALAVGASIDLGNAYSFTPTAIGQSGDELEFEYLTSSGEVINGLIEYTGLFNNMVLTVDPTNGDAAITNESSFGADILGYTISSPSGSLLPGDADWSSFEDQGIGTWEEANPSANFLSELNPTGSSLFNTANRELIGSPWDIAGERDLAIQFLLDDGSILDGIVEYGPIEPIGESCIDGDTSPCNGAVDIDDLNAVRNNFGTGDGSDTSGIAGDTAPFDGFVNLDDLNSVRNNFGNMAAAAVPEPTAGLMLCLSLGLMGLVRCTRRR